MDLSLPSPVHTLCSPEWAGRRSISIKRDDLIHPVISGNKARKLYTLIEQIQYDKPMHLLTMGGNRSNFLHALGYLCHRENIKLTACIRGHRPEHYSRTLQDLDHWGTDLRFTDKINYRQLREDPDYPHTLARQLNAQWLPEGGSNAQALPGIVRAVSELEPELNKEPDCIFVPVGTGCTALGLARGILQRGWNTRVIGVVVLKGAEGKNGIATDIHRLARQTGFDTPGNLHLEHRFCGKGFGRQSPELAEQQTYFEQLWDIPLDPVYSVKMCNAFKTYCQEDNPLLGSNTLLWHTGGLQGNR